MIRMLAAMIAIVLTVASLVAEDAPAAGDLQAGLQTLQQEFLVAKAHATAALKTKTLADLEAAHAEINALLPRVGTWTDTAHKAGWDDERIDREVEKTAWPELHNLVRGLKDEISRLK